MAITGADVNLDGIIPISYDFAVVEGTVMCSIITFAVGDFPSDIRPAVCLIGLFYLVIHYLSILMY